MSSPYTSCDYLSRKGPCGKRCFGGRTAPTEKGSLSPLAATAAGRALQASRATVATRRPAAGGRTTSSTGYGPGRARWRPSLMSSWQ